MQLLKNNAHVYGFEDYNIVSVSDSCFYYVGGFNVPNYFEGNTGNYIISKDLSIEVNKDAYGDVESFEPELAVDHKELLNTAKKVFVHPSCKLSRSMLAEKYKKSLNPYLSDAVVIPKPFYKEFRLTKTALFINDSAKLIVMVDINDSEAAAVIQNAMEGARFEDLIKSAPKIRYSSNMSYDINDMLKAELFYYGDLLYIPNTQSWARDLLTHSIPSDKIVFEESVQESLGCENNQLDFDSLCSIKDMLESSDENTVSAGLKALSMMDWMHYPNSIKFMLNNVDSKSNWIYNKACNSTSVKYMITTIAGNHSRKRTWWPGDYDYAIYEKDFELFLKLKCHYHHIQPNDVMNHIRSISFVKVNEQGFLAPNLKVANK